MMFVSAYPVCSPALPVSYWAEAAAASVNPRVFEHSGPRRQHPLHDAFSAEAVKRTSSSFYISDILYPSVIPLPGTLPHSNSGSPCADSPHSPPARQTCDSRGTTSFPVVTTAVATTPVKSSDLKFGIDRILADDKAVKDRLTDGGHDKKPLTKTSLAAPTPVISYCPCSAPSSTYGMVYAPLSYSSAHGTHPLVQIQHATHPVTRSPTSPPGGYHQMARQSDFPGPYAALASETHPTQQQQPKRKRSWSRAVFSNLQRKGLEKRFEVQKYVTKPDRRQLAAMLGLTDAQVKVWFQNRRMKWRHAEDAKRKRDEEETCKRDGTDSEKENGTTLDSPDSIMRVSDEQENENGEMVNGDVILQTSDSESDSEHEIMLDS